MKKIFKSALMLNALLLVGCGGSKEPSEPNNSIVNPQVTKYKITFNDEEGNLLTSIEVEENSVPTYTYSKEDTKEWDYTFIGWSTSKNGEVLASLPKATSNATYFAIVNKVKQRYTVTFDSLGGPSVSSITEDYGTSINEPAKIEMEGKKFVAWCSDSNLTKVVTFPFVLEEDVTLYAKWNDKVDMSNLLLELFDVTKKNPGTIIPKAMNADYNPNLVDRNNIISDYETSFVDISNIDTRCFGEQWNMVSTNIN